MKLEPLCEDRFNDKIQIFRKSPKNSNIQLKYVDAFYYFKYRFYNIYPLIKFTH